MSWLMVLRSFARLQCIAVAHAAIFAVPGTTDVLNFVIFNYTECQIYHSCAYLIWNLKRHQSTGADKALASMRMYVAALTVVHITFVADAVDYTVF